MPTQQQKNNALRQLTNFIREKETIDPTTAKFIRALYQKNNKSINNLLQNKTIKHQQYLRNTNKFLILQSNTKNIRAALAGVKKWLQQ
jgi:hypothetical protein